MLSDSFFTYLFDLLDGFTEEYTPGGVAVDNDVMNITNRAYDYYISKNGVPTTANEARKMFEWAAALETTIAILTTMEHVE